MPKPFLWAIVNPDGSLWVAESCVCEDREPLNDQVRDLNADAGLTVEKGYRVIALYRRVSRGKNEPAHV